MVLWVDDRWVLYYTATSEPAAARSSSPPPSRRTSCIERTAHGVPDELTGTGAGPTESPFVVSVDGTYYLLIGPDWEGLVTSHERTGGTTRPPIAARGCSRTDPLHFDLDGLVTVVDAHAGEVIVDEEGGRWLSHCGWGQRGVFLAPLSIGAE
jgi:beta-fructofuranosidase